MGMKSENSSLGAERLLDAQVRSHNSFVKPVQGEMHVHSRSICPDQPPTFLELLQANPVLLHVSQSGAQTAAHVTLQPSAEQPRAYLIELCVFHGLQGAAIEVAKPGRVSRHHQEILSEAKEHQLVQRLHVSLVLLILGGALIVEVCQEDVGGHILVVVKGVLQPSKHLEGLPLCAALGGPVQVSSPQQWPADLWHTGLVVPGCCKASSRS